MGEKYKEVVWGAEVGGIRRAEQFSNQSIEIQSESIEDIKARHTLSNQYKITTNDLYQYSI